MFNFNLCDFANKMKLWYILAVILGVCGPKCYGFLNVSPFFFLCNYHGNVQELGINSGEVSIGVNIAGNPHYYVPGQFYEVSVTSSLNFDGFLLTGLYTVTDSLLENLLGGRVGGLYGGVNPTGQNLMCSIVHSHLSPRPQHRLTFMWMAPPEGTGCISFLATATLGQQLLFKDTTVFQMCEEGVTTTSPIRPQLAELHSDAVILRDDFDSYPDFKPDLWQSHQGAAVSDGCGGVLFGDAALFCDKVGTRELVSVPLNLTSAKVVQFALSAGTCGREDSQDKDIVVMFGLNHCSDWFEIERIRAPASPNTEIHLLTLPPKARGVDICLKWKQTPFPLKHNPVPYNLPTKRPTYPAKTTVTTISSTTVSPSKTLPTKPVPAETKETVTTIKAKSTSPQTKPTQEVIVTEEQTAAVQGKTTEGTEMTTSDLTTETDVGTLTTESASSVTSSTPFSEQHSTVTMHNVFSSTTENGFSSTSATSVEESVTDFLTTETSHYIKESTTAFIGIVLPQDSPSKGLRQPGTKTGLGTKTGIGTKTGLGTKTGFGAKTRFGTKTGLGTKTKLGTKAGPGTKSGPLGSTTQNHWGSFGKRFKRYVGNQLWSKGKIPGDPASTAQTKTNKKLVTYLPSVDDEAVGTFKSCWGVDNIVVVNTASPPSILEDSFDPVDPSNWIFFPGANIKQNCHSDSNIMSFSDQNQTDNFVVTRDLDLQVPHAADVILEQDFETKTLTGWEVLGGQTSRICGEVKEAKSLVFTGPNKRHACTGFLHTPEAATLQFYFAIGSGTCHSSGSPKTVVSVYLEDRNGNTYVLEKLEPHLYHEPRLVSLSLSVPRRVSEVKVCWLQKYNTGLYRDVWSLDGVRVLPLVPATISHVVQFDINLQCSHDPQPNSVFLEYSTNHGRTWTTLFSQCLPTECEDHYQSTSSQFSSQLFPGWSHLTLPIPYVTMVPHVRFRWKQEKPGRPNWAIENVFIGSCPEGCNGHGTCTGEMCRCDFGYQGISCKESLVPRSTALNENFEDSHISVSSAVFNIHGATIGYDCGVVSSGKGLVFNGGGTREIGTLEMNTTNAYYLQYSLRVGSESSTSRCPPPDLVTESVLLEYSCNGGITWNLLRHFASHHYRTPRGESIVLPDSSKGVSCQFRFRQPQHSGHGLDVWALDELSVSRDLANTLSVEAEDMKDMSDRLTANLGKLIDSYCGAPRSITFIGKEKNGEPRYLMTESMQIGPSYMLQFDVVMGCRLAYSKNLDNDLYLEYSLDHGVSWLLVRDPCLPPAVCDAFHQGTVYDATRFTDWQTVTELLPSDTWSASSRFRWMQPDWGPTDHWSIRRIYIGQQCPRMCSGHGKCNEGICKCDRGFAGDSCKPEVEMESQIHADFGMRYKPEADFQQIIGGEVVRANEGCGPILSGESIYFSKDGVRELQLKDLDTTSSDFVQFYLRIAGGDWRCRGAEQRSQSVLLQFSVDGGIQWQLLEELLHTDYQTPRFVHLDLPEKAKNPSTRFRWWQPSHSGQGHDQWAIDEIHIGHYERLRVIDDDFGTYPDPLESGNWMTVTDGVIGKYCQQSNPGLVLSNQPNDKMVVTKDLDLAEGHVIQFKINVGCGKMFRWDHPVMLQYSDDNGRSWHLVEEPCYQDQDCDGHHVEGSIYYPGTHGDWQLVVIPVKPNVVTHPVVLRWWQPGGTGYSFSLDDVYIGPACPNHCHRHGFCHDGECRCQETYTYPDCVSDRANPSGMLDRFDNRNQPTAYWQRILGGYLGRGCGIVDHGNSLYFSEDGTREAVTDPLNTTSLRMLQFVVKIGSSGNHRGCRAPQTRHEGIVVDFSTDNQITWTTLKVVEPRLYNHTSQVVAVDLPPEAKTPATVFRWWQPLGIGGMPRAQWALDSVMIDVNDSNAFGFQDNFNSMMPDPHNWFIADSAVPRLTCNSNGNALEFSANHGLRFAETWDYHVTPSTFLQFDLAMGCGSLYGTLYSVMLEYSVNMGKTWHPVTSECKPPNFECSGYHLSSEYMSEQHMNWTRVTVYPPPGAISTATRFRWLQHTSHPRGTVWALDNVYLGNGCSWLCSGHGYCDKGKCICDEGFSEPFCVPTKPLPMMLRDDFNTETVVKDNWREIYGGENTDTCGNLVSGNALAFHKDKLRMAVTQDIDTSMLNTIEFYFQYGCHGKDSDWPRSHSVLLQYSTNGGITWKLLKELHYRNETGVRYFTVSLPMDARMNASRFRFWQPENGGEMQSAWAIDNLFLGTMPMNPNSLFDKFDNQPDPASWLFVNNGKVDEYCHFNTRKDTETAGQSSVVFRRTTGGELSIITRDLDIGPMSVLQFDINVGCGSDPTHKYPVRLEFSSNGGKSWKPVVPNCAASSVARCFESKLPPTLYYGGSSPFWRRIIVPLDHLHVCGSVRFRWYQGKVPKYDFAPEWAIDNVYIGMACTQHCNGHGSCIGGKMCFCDRGYRGETCIAETPSPTYLKEDFYINDVIISGPRRGDLASQNVLDGSPDFNNDQWWSVSGGRRSRQCGVVFTGPSLHYGNSGERTLVTNELDLRRVSTIQFYLKLGCYPDVDPSSPIFLQYSINGGVEWHTIEQFDFNANSNKPQYVALHLPPPARTNSTHIRWWQPSHDGTYSEDWAIDQIYIGGDVYGEQVLQDDPTSPRDTSWLMYPGGTVQKVCHYNTEALHFNGDESMRYAISADVDVVEGSYIQFYLSMGCNQTSACYNIHLQFSLDMGKTWSLLQPACLPSNVDCSTYFSSSVYSSDIYSGWNRITVPLPYYTRSKVTRFRWEQPVNFHKGETWALAHLYIGRECGKMCRGHGRCSDAHCVCDVNWMGPDCNESVTPLPRSLVEDFSIDHVVPDNWLKVVGGQVTKPCQVLAAGHALHFTEGCNRFLVSRDLDLSSAMLIEFHFLFGCMSFPVRRDQSVLVDYSTDGGTTWVPLVELYYNLYRTPTFVSIKLPPEAKTKSSRVRWWQPQHPGPLLGDWVVDNIRVNGDDHNPTSLTSNFTDTLNTEDFPTADNLESQQYCGLESAAVGTTRNSEASTLVTREVTLEDNYVLRFSINVGCGVMANISVPPVYLTYSVDHGVTWHDLRSQCLPGDAQCQRGPQMSTVYYGSPDGHWQRVIIPLNGLPISNHTRFRWQQKPDELLTIHHWAIKDLYVGPACVEFCHGHGYCRYPQCICDENYEGERCDRPHNITVLTQLKDTFDKPGINYTKWLLVQSGAVGNGCSRLVEGTSLVFTGPGMRQAVSRDLDLRNAKFIQYTAMIGGDSGKPGCFIPLSRDHSVIVQYSVDGGISWHTIHTLDFASYVTPHQDYLPLPLPARTSSSRIRWWQPLPSDPSLGRPVWALDNVFVGGTEINPSEVQLSFNDSLQQDDATLYEFSPYGQIGENSCSQENGVLSWKEGKGVRSFTTNQLIVQPGYMLQFKIIVGCSDHYNVCDSHTPIRLEYNKNPLTDRWQLVRPQCLPGEKTRAACRPYQHHDASLFSLSEYPSWTRVAIELPQTTFSGSTRFRWIQDGLDEQVASWALDDIYVGEQCPNMCSGRGHCLNGRCVCDTQYYGSSCKPLRKNLISRMYESFEGGIYPSNWQTVSGGKIGFGCGALLPYAHGKTLYFNGCGIRQAITAELDLTTVVKIIFVIQIGCRAQTTDCNVKVGDEGKYRGVLLQYSLNKGIDWQLVARHDTEEFLRARRMVYTVPGGARGPGVNLRWWQPVHDGAGFDQWAIDNVEIIFGKKSYRQKWSKG